MQIDYPIVYGRGARRRIGGITLDIAEATPADAPVVARQHLASRASDVEFRYHDGNLWQRETRPGGREDELDLLPVAGLSAGQRLKIQGAVFKMEDHPLTLGHRHYRSLQAAWTDSVLPDPENGAPEALADAVADNLERAAGNLLYVGGKLYRRSPGPELVLGMGRTEGRYSYSHDSCRGMYHPHHLVGSFRVDAEEELRETCAMAGLRLDGHAAGHAPEILDPLALTGDPYPCAMEAAGWTLLRFAEKTVLSESDGAVRAATVALRNAMLSRVPDADWRVDGFLREDWPHDAGELHFPEAETLAPLISGLVDAFGGQDANAVSVARLALARTALRQVPRNDAEALDSLTAADFG